MNINCILKEIADSQGNKYYALDVLHNDMDILLNHLRVNGIDEAFISKKMNRDKGNFHITVVNAAYSHKYKDDAIFNAEINKILGKEFTVSILGIGSIEKTEKDVHKQTWFGVCKNEELELFLHKFQMKQDLHVTLAFNPTDVFGLRKNEESIIYPISKIVPKFKP